MAINDLMLKGLYVMRDEIQDKSKINIVKIKDINPIIKNARIQDFESADFEAFKQHLLWCHSELLELYKQMNRYIEFTERIINVVNKSKNNKKIKELKEQIEYVESDENTN